MQPQGPLRAWHGNTVYRDQLGDKRPRSRQSGGVTVAIRDCIDAEHTRLDGELNRRYRALMRGLPSAKAQALRQSERRWLIDRKRKCDAAGNSEAGGTLQMIMIDSCYLDSLYDRVSTLRAMQR